MCALSLRPVVVRRIERHERNFGAQWFGSERLQKLRFKILDVFAWVNGTGGNSLCGSRLTISNRLIDAPLFIQHEDAVFSRRTCAQSDEQP